MKDNLVESFDPVYLSDLTNSCLYYHLDDDLECDLCLHRHNSLALGPWEHSPLRLVEANYHLRTLPLVKIGTLSNLFHLKILGIP